MPRVDDRIRRELKRLEVPVDGRGAFQRVDRRRRRLRAARRARSVALVAAVAIGTAAGTVGLLRLFDADRSARIGSNGTREPTATSNPSTAGTMSSTPSSASTVPYACDLSTAEVDLDGDGAEDLLQVFSPVEVPTGPDLPAMDVVCSDPTVGARYVARLQVAAGPPEAAERWQDLPECAMPFSCRLLATPDLDRDGAPEVTIQIGAGASTLQLALYRFDAGSTDRWLRRLEVAAPGDPWDETWGLRPGPSIFDWFGSVTHQHWLSCDEDPEHRLAVMTGLRGDDPSVQHVHGVLLTLEGFTLVPGFSWDEEVPDGSLEIPTDLCGSELALGG